MYPVAPTRGSETNRSPSAVSRAIDQLHRCSGQPRFLDRFGRLFGKQSRRFRMGTVGLADHRVASCNGRGKVAAGDAAKGEWEVVGTEDTNRSERLIAGSNSGRGVDRWQRPAPASAGSSCGSQLVAGARQFDVGQARALGQSGFAIG